MASNSGSHGTDAEENSPRKMEFDELSNRVIENWAQDCWSRPMSSAFVLFVSFAWWNESIKQFCASARGTSFSSRPFVALTQGAKMSRHQDR